MQSRYLMTSFLRHETKKWTKFGYWIVRPPFSLSSFTEIDSAKMELTIMWSCVDLVTHIYRGSWSVMHACQMLFSATVCVSFEIRRKSTQSSEGSLQFFFFHTFTWLWNQLVRENIRLKLNMKNLSPGISSPSSCMERDCECHKFIGNVFIPSTGTLSSRTALFHSCLSLGLAIPAGFFANIICIIELYALCSRCLNPWVANAKISRSFRLNVVLLLLIIYSFIFLYINDDGDCSKFCLFSLKIEAADKSHKSI